MMMKLRCPSCDRLTTRSSRTCDSPKSTLPTQFNVNQKCLNFCMQIIGQNNTIIKTELKRIIKIAHQIHLQMQNMFIYMI